jgi:hypothetical protein
VSGLLNRFQLSPKWILWTYYGGTWLDRISTFDPVSQQPFGYGYSGSPNNLNRTIHEITGGLTRVFWNNPNYGTLWFSVRYSWLVRHPWHVAPVASLPAQTSIMVYLGFRYLLPSAVEASNRDKLWLTIRAVTG